MYTRYVSVPVHHTPHAAAAAAPAAPRMRVAYTVHGAGARLVVMVPGLATPGSMYAKLRAHLDPRVYTLVTVDNRGSGASDAPLACAARVAAAAWAAGAGAAYSPDALARDAWAAADAVRRGAAAGAPFKEEVALVGHSMGGMVVQRMAVLRPRAVRFCALMATHAGGGWNLGALPAVLRAALRIAWNKFDGGAVALANLDMHFTPRFLEHLVWKDPFSTRNADTEDAGGAGAGEDVVQGLSEARRVERTARRRPRRDVYLARYCGRDFEWGVGPEVDASQREVVDKETPGDKSPHLAPLRHLMVVLQHRLTQSEQRCFRRCSRLRALVLAGTDDKVTLPFSSRALAHGIGAVAYVELPGAHFFFDERAAHVNALVALGLRNAFRDSSKHHDGESDLDSEVFAGRDELDCLCSWCKEGAGMGGGDARKDDASWLRTSLRYLVDVLTSGLDFRKRQ